ncbi:MAG TPA: glycosyltransferase [Chitinophagaceae bacterium]|nr:glycosyltransferase [Chitinophagaceae bacterium]
MHTFQTAPGVAEIRRITAASSPVRVLHIIKSLGRGGAELLLAETLKKHNKSKYHFHYLYFLPWKNQVVQELEAAGGTVICFPANNNIEILLQERKIAAYVKEHRIQLIHCHLPWGGVAGRLAGRITRVPVIYTEHNKWERYHPLTFYMNKWTFSMQQQVIAVSAEVAKSIRQHFTKPDPPVEVVVNGIDTLKFSRLLPVSTNVRNDYGISPDAIVIGIACVFRAQKRLHTWLELATQLHRLHPQLQFIIAGDGPLREEIHRQTKELKATEYIHFAGMQQDIRPWLYAMDIFMMTSSFEGLPLALLEAMSMGCIPACTNAGGINEVVQDQQNGLLAPVNEPLQLLNSISQLLNRPEKMEALKVAARKTVVRHFDMQAMVLHLQKIYDQLLTSPFKVC